MTHAPVVLVHIYTCKHVHSPLPQDIWAHEVFALPPKPPATSQTSFSVNLCQHMHLGPMPSHGTLCHPITKAPYLDH